MLSTIIGKFSVGYAAGISDSQLQEWHDLLVHWFPGKSLPGAERLSQAAVFRLDSALGPLFIKRHFELGFKGLLCFLRLRTPALLRAFRMGLQAQNADLHTAAPYCSLIRRCSFGYETILITRFLPGTNPWKFLDLPAAELQTMLIRLGTEIANWHASGLRNRDLKGPNLLYDRATQAFNIIDLNGVFSHPPQPSFNLRAKDLSRCKASALRSGLTEAQWQVVQDAYLSQCRQRQIEIRDADDFEARINEGVRQKVERYLKLKRDFH